LASEPADGKQAEMAIAKWAGAANPDAKAIETIAEKLTEQAIAGIGGLQRFVKKGDVIWIKPNIGWDQTPDKAANTNPQVVATIIRHCLDAGAKTIKIGDYTCHPAKKSYHSSGVAAAAKALGAEVLFLDESRSKTMTIGGEKLKEMRMFPEILDTDLVINVPVVKHHSLATITVCMKNYMGVVADRKTFHQDLPTCIADITRFMKPRICIVDAVRILTDHGPTGGDLADVKTPLTVAAGTDIVALDAFGAELLGHKPESIASVAKGAKEKLGTLDYRSLPLREIAVS
jgi:uncharacterized protein (DUF362 family)